MENHYYDVQTGKFNLSAIMKMAWSRIIVRNHLKERFALSLSMVWIRAELEKERATLPANVVKANNLRREACSLEHKSRLSSGDYKLINELKDQASVLEAA